MQTLMSRLTLWLMILAFPAMAVAEDVDVYGVSTISVQPNILIIFDTSGSMDTNDVPVALFDPKTSYAGSYLPGKVYRRDCTVRVSSLNNTGWCRRNPSSPFCQPTYVRTCSNNWTEFAPDTAAIGCQPVRSSLATNSYARGQLTSTSPYSCSGNAVDEQELRTGNYLNYLAAGLGSTRRRIEVAKQVVVDLINRTEGVRFGLMRFNNEEGGRVVAPLGTSKGTLVSTVNGFSASGWTPLAETLAEAGLYFAGKTSWFNTNTTYTSPIEHPCQKNYVILVTDGAPTRDDNIKLTTEAYINGDLIGDQDGDGRDPGTYENRGTDYLDDVAYYLRTRDLRSDLGAADSQFEFQNVTTYTIGFKTAHQLLQDTAENGGGAYYTAENYTALTEAFDNIINSIQERNASYVAPVVPINRLNRTFAGNRLYLGFFKPQINGRWRGNLKAYNLTPDGTLLDRNNMPATNERGLLIDGIQSIWSSSYDGYDVDRGGVGEALATRTAARKIYTYLGSQANLTESENALSVSNAGLTDTLLGVAGATARSNTILSARAEGAAWPMGDIIHSEPLVEHYFTDGNGNGKVDSGELKSYIFVGANDGMLHVFDDDDGSEAWAFVPPGQLNRLSLLNNATHDYFVDGSSMIFDDGTTKTLIVGERRGGSRYYALDVTNPVAPKWKYQLTSSLLVGLDGDGNGVADGSAATLGQSWSRPQQVTLKIQDRLGDYLLMAGGYDVNQDAAVPAANDLVGKALFTVRADNGAVEGLNVNGGNWDKMTNCIVDFTGVETKGNGLVNRVYAGDLGGHLFALRDDDHDGAWDKRLLFSLPGSLTVDSVPVTIGRKFMNKPEVGLLRDGEILYIGTGDREKPTSILQVDAFYAIRNRWQTDDQGNYVTLTPSDLLDVTANKIQEGTAEERVTALKVLNASQGWFIRLPNPGEKVVSSPILFNKVVYFTTYTPPTSVLAASDPCATSMDRGIARLYAIDYLNGAAVYDFYEDPANPKTLTKEDRAVEIGTSIPSSPIITILKDGPRIMVGVEGGIMGRKVNTDSTVHQYYWQQIR